MKRQKVTSGLRCLLFLSVLLLLQACGSARRSEPIRGPLPLQEEQVAKGRVVFIEYCHTCHPGGETGLGPALNNKPVPGFMLRLQVRQGLGAMPAFKKDRISPQKLDQLVAYLKVLRRHGEN